MEYKRSWLVSFDTLAIKSCSMLPCNANFTLLYHRKHCKSCFLLVGKFSLIVDVLCALFASLKARSP